MNSRGEKIVLHESGALEIIPDELTEETYHLLITCACYSSNKDCSHLIFLDTLIDDIVSGFQYTSIHCLFIFGEKNDNLQDSRLFNDALKQAICTFWQDATHRFHLDVTPSYRSSIYQTVAYSPKVRGAVRSRRLFEFLELSHIDAVVLHNAPTTTLSWFIANTYETDSVQIELPTSDLSCPRHYLGFELTIRDFLAQEKNEHISKPAKYFCVTRTIVKQSHEFKFLFDEHIANFSRFKHGEVFGIDGDKPLMAKNDGEAILYPNSHVAVGDVSALMVYDVLPRFENDQLIYD